MVKRRGVGKGGGQLQRFLWLPFVLANIDMTQIHIYKPKGRFVEKYFSFKSNLYIMQLQVVVD
jgi:hypothetical protein